MDINRITLISFVVVVLVYCGAGIPMALGYVRPNAVYGVRLPQTMNNESLWYSANRYCTVLMVGVGLCTLLVAVGGFLLPRIGGFVYAMICVGALTVGALVMLGLTLKYVSEHSS